MLELWFSIPSKQFVVQLMESGFVGAAVCTDGGFAVAVAVVGGPLGVGVAAVQPDISTIRRRDTMDNGNQRLDNICFLLLSSLAYGDASPNIVITCSQIDNQTHLYYSAQS